MKAMIFAAGVGSRLKPWTDSHPKALVEIGHVPMLGRVIDNIINAGITDIIVNVHHFAEQIYSFIERSNFNADITVSDETELLLETGGGIRKVLDLIGNESVLVHNADILTDLSLKEFISYNSESEADVCLLTAERDTSRYLVFDERNYMKGWINISTGETKPAGFALTDGLKMRAFNGVHIINPSVFDSLRAYLPDNVPFSIVNFYVDNCRHLKIKSFEISKRNFWFDIGKPETLAKAQSFFKH